MPHHERGPFAQVAAEPDDQVIAAVGVVHDLDGASGRGKPVFQPVRECIERELITAGRLVLDQRHQRVEHFRQTRSKMIDQISLHA